MAAGSHMTAEIWSLTLEIIRLLTGETNPDTQSGDHVTITVSPPPSLTPDRCILQKILDVTRKITELLTGEVGGAGISGELSNNSEEIESPLELCLKRKLENEAEPVKGKAGYSGVDMKMEPSGRKPVKSPLGEYGDGSAAGETDESSEEPCEEEESSHVIGADLGDALTSNNNPEEVMPVMIKEEETLPEISPDPGDTMERNIKPVGEEEVSVKTEEEKIPLLINPDGSYTLNKTTKPAAILSHGEMEDNIIAESTEALATKTPCPAMPPSDLSSYPSTHSLCLTVPLLPLTAHTEEKQYSCSECGRCFSNESHLARHKRVHPVESPHSFSYFETMKHGTILPHGEMENNIIAESTGALTTQPPHPALPPADLSSYFSTHSVCLTVPPLPHTTYTEEKQYSCSECGRCFSNESQLARHKRVHPVEWPHSFSNFEKYLSQKSDHIIHDHTGEKPHSCSECGKCFSNKSNLVRHTKVHTQEKPHSCSNCEKCLSQKSDLIIHERVHTGEKPYACSDCGKCFSQKSALVIHERRIHTGEKPYSCSECGKCFSQKWDLIKHERIHTGVKPYSCSECGKCFATHSNLARHKIIHKGNWSLQHMTVDKEEKPFSCSKCGKGFSRKSTLIIHERVHTGWRPYSCSECGKCFSQKGHLISHERVHTGVRPYSCSECGKCFSNHSNLSQHKRVHKAE